MSVIIQSGYSPTPELTHARIGYESIAYGKTPTASSATSGYPAIAATYPTTYEYWQPTAVPATWAIDNAVPVACDFVGLVGDFNGGTVAVQYSDDGSSWTTQVSGQITGRVTMFLFESVTARYWRIQVTNQIPSVSVVYIGKALAMQRRIYQGHSPLTLSRNTELTNNISEGGQYLGRSIVRQGVATDAAWSHLKADWYRSNFDPFVQSARTLPFFFAWRPSQFPQELGFVWTDGDIQPTNSGPKDYMSVSLNMRGIYNTSRILLPGSYDFRPSQVLTASRATTATYIDDAGLLQTAAANVLRYQGGQVLVEGGATNLLRFSSGFSEVAYWGATGTAVVTANAAPAPDGTMTADLVVITPGAGADRVDQSMPGVMPTAGDTYTYSVWLKGSGTLQIAINTDTGAGGSAEIDVVLTSVWTRYSATHTFLSGVTGNLRVHGVIMRNPGSATANIWGGQVEAGATASSYIPTTTSPATRAADLITVAA